MNILEFICHNFLEIKKTFLCDENGKFKRENSRNKIQDSVNEDVED